MTNIFEHVGMWPNAKNKKENAELPPEAYLEEIGSGLVAVKADTPTDKLEQVMSFAGSIRHLTDELPWVALKGRILCTHDSFERLKNVKQEIGSYTMTFPADQVDLETLSKLEPYFDGYELDRNNAKNGIFHVFVKKEGHA